jgi:uncharacterized protein YdeI (YjbR/CyaY-like superfamily)
VSKAIKKAELEIIAFASPRLWEKWLAHNHSRSPGVWVRFFKKDSGRETVQTAKKPETREKRMKEILAMLAAGKQFHPNGGTDVTR